MCELSIKPSDGVLGRRNFNAANNGSSNEGGPIPNHETESITASSSTNIASTTSPTANVMRRRSTSTTNTNSSDVSGTGNKNNNSNKRMHQPLTDLGDRQQRPR